MTTELTDTDPLFTRLKRAVVSSLPPQQIPDNVDEIVEACAASIRTSQLDEADRRLLWEEIGISARMMK